MTTPEELLSRVRPALHDVLDPETGISLVDLGLVYDVAVDDSGLAFVLLTLTSPACPASDVIISGIRRRLLLVEGVREVMVKITFEPPWTADRITPSGRAQLGW